MAKKEKEQKYRDTRKTSLESIASMFGGLTGKAVEAKRKRKQKMKEKKKY